MGRANLSAEWRPGRAEKHPNPAERAKIRMKLDELGCPSVTLNRQDAILITRLASPKT
jgi:hypothetical protein